MVLEQQLPALLNWVVVTFTMYVDTFVHVFSSKSVDYQHKICEVVKNWGLMTSAWGHVNAWLHLDTPPFTLQRTSYTMKSENATLCWSIDSDVNSGGLTADAVDHERVQLLLAMFALAREVWHGLDLSVEQIVQQCQCHFLRCATVGGDVQHIGCRHWTPNSHLWVVLISQPGALWEIL